VSEAREEDRYLKIGHGLNQWPQCHLLVKMLCDALQDAGVRQRERPIRLREHSHSPKPRQRLVGVHERQTERICELPVPDVGRARWLLELDPMPRRRQC
jgi:hypothetical protein